MKLSKREWLLVALGMVMLVLLAGMVHVAHSICVELLGPVGGTILTVAGLAGSAGIGWLVVYADH